MLGTFFLIMEKIRIKKQVTKFNDEILQDKIENVLINLKAKFDELTKEGWTNLEIEKEYGCDYQEYILNGFNMETDEEFEKRKSKLEKEKKDAELKLEKEKSEYQRLKAKFGDL